MLDGFKIKNAVFHKGDEVLQIQTRRYGRGKNSKIEYCVYFSGPKERGRRVKPIYFLTDTLDNLAEQIEEHKAEEL